MGPVSDMNVPALNIREVPLNTGAPLSRGSLPNPGLGILARVAIPIAGGRCKLAAIRTPALDVYPGQEAGHFSPYTKEVIVNNAQGFLLVLLPQVVYLSLMFRQFPECLLVLGHAILNEEEERVQLCVELLVTGVSYLEERPYAVLIVPSKVGHSVRCLVISHDVFQYPPVYPESFRGREAYLFIDSDLPSHGIVLAEEVHD